MFKGKNYARALQELYALQRRGMRPALGPARRFLAILGNPQKKLRCIQVAGTNGKGSTTAMIAAALRAAGHKTGAYYSPHVSDFRERFLINGRPVSKQKILATLRWMGKKYETARKRGAAPEYLTFFEWSTALAFCLFAREKADAAVLETGLGGRFDAVTAASPLACVITNISPEHTAILGKTVSSIAREKAGIIKRGVPVICGARQPAAQRAIVAAARRKKAPLLRMGRDFQLHGNALTAHNGARLKLQPGMKGEFQLANAALAAQALLARNDFGVSPRHIEQGISKARLPGRFEEVRWENARVIYDVAHNPAAVKELAANLKAQGAEKCGFVFGVLGDKDFVKMLKDLAPLATKMWCVTPSDARAVDAKTVARAAKHLGIRAVAAVPGRIPLKGTLCVTGSFTTVELMKKAWG